MFRTTIDPTKPIRPCSFVQFHCPRHGLVDTVSQLGLAAVLCFPCSQEHTQQIDPWCSVQLCDHYPYLLAPKETRPMSLIRVTDTIIPGVATVDLVNLADFLDGMFAETPDPVMTGRTITALVDKLNTGNPTTNVEPECAYLGIKVERL